MTARRNFLREVARAAAASMLMAACEQEKLFGVPAKRPIAPDFFGHMVQGEWILDDGSLAREVSVYFGLLRLWDSRAVWWKMANDPAALNANLLFAESVGADTMFVFGEPPASAIAPGKTKMPTKDAWISFVREIARQILRFTELWNEPAEGYWDGTPEELVQYCRIAYPILSSSGKMVCSPSLSSLTLPHGYEFADRFLAAGGGDWCDEIAFHSYPSSPDSLREDVRVLRALLAKHRVSRKIRNTEYNLVPTDPTLRPAYMAQSLIELASLDVNGAVWDPEPTESANDYTDPTMRRVANLLLGASVGEIREDGRIRRCTISRAGSPDRELTWSGDSFPAFTIVAKAA